MGSGLTIATVGSASWGRVIERLCFLFPPTVAVGAVGLLWNPDGASMLERGPVVLGATGYAVLSVATGLALYLDAREIREADVGGWQPRPRLVAALGLLCAPAAGAVYLFRRHLEFGTPAARPGWWLVVAGSLAGTVVGVAVAAVAVALSLPTLVAVALGAAGAAAYGAFPAAIHQDAAYVCTRNAGWRPNPGGYLGLAFLSLAVPVFQPVLAAYYLRRRWSAIGLSRSSVPLVGG